MSIDGTVRQGMIVPDMPFSLPDGTRVRIEPTQLPQPSGVRQGGWWRGRITIAADFDDLPPDIASAFGITDE